jgi:hypothetical protein
MKKRLFTTAWIVLIFAFVLCSCAQNTPKYIEGEEYDKVSAISAPYAEHILKGIESKDRSLFATDFDEKMLEAMTEEKFSSITETYAKLGIAQSCDLINIVDKESYYGVNYKVSFPDKVMAMLIVIDKKEPNLVSGLWFK